ncbi:hypothetical protein Mal4_16130 [Maioricimonas rarisocia]|uniref:Lipoprotein n=1 Tax=Maioricimonas rarisocia TaxID=2528026 RepID=A0A517Z486_9PLAN|nr:DUF6263 family protein [Maioricimonas rarisocia]QDU37303.1 hypothetical protein Mal4_16130 [Maioricimonas rarisocia]
MMWRSSLPLFAMLLLVTGLSGCGFFGSSEDEAEIELPEWLTEETPAAGPDASAVQPAAAQSAAAMSAVPAVPTAPPQSRARLELKLHPGDRFPLRKVVSQELTQAALNGTPQVSRSQLDLLLAITVKEVTADRTHLGITYDRVRFTQDIGGERIEYDSANPPQQIPPVLQAYHGMVRDGFSFWIGQDNRIVEIVGFQQFLERCLANVPVDRRQQVLLAMEAGTGEKGISDFIDNTIGLLPYNTETSPGDTWRRPRRISRPVPMELNTNYTLTELNDQFAVVQIEGTIAPSTTLGHGADTNPNVRITVKGGSATGQCTLFRDTGLPRESRVTRTVDMKVTMASGIEFDQHKRTETVIEAYPGGQRQNATSIGLSPAPSPAPALTPPLNVPAVQQATHQASGPSLR